MSNSTSSPSSSGFLFVGDRDTHNTSVFENDWNTVQQGDQLNRLKLDNLNRITPKQIVNEDTMFVISDCEDAWEGGRQFKQTIIR